MLARALLLFLIPLSIHADEVTPDEFRPRPYVDQRPMTREVRLRLIEHGEKYAGKYLAEIESISFKSFEGRDMSAEVIAALVHEVDDTKVLMRKIVENLKALREQPDDLKGWLLLTRDYYSIENYMQDIERFGLVRSNDYVGLRMMMPPIFDGILLPAIASRK